MKPFHFREFSVEQDSQIFRVGTDAVLLGALATVGFNDVLEVGSGTGIISLMVAQRSPGSQIIALDIDENATRLSRLNFQQSPFRERMTAVNADFSKFESRNQFQQIISNPPYFEVNSSQKDVAARQQGALQHSILIKKSSDLLAADGLFSVILPFYNSDNFAAECNANELYLRRKINIFGIEGGSITRVILEFSKTYEDPKQENFTIEKSPRQYSDQYLEATAAFHMFKNR